MTNWKEYKLEDVATVQTGPFGSQLHQKDYVDIGTPIITVEHLGDNRITYQNLPKVTAEDKARLRRYHLQEGDVVFSRVGSVDRRALVTKKEDGWLFSGRCLRVRADEKLANGAFLSYYFGQENFKEYIRRIAVGATMPSINTKILSEIVITLPNLPTQTAIAEILSSLDDKIELNNKINQELENLAQTLFKQWFIDFEFPNENGEPYKSSGGEMVDSELGEIPKGWEVGVLEDLIDFYNGNAFKSKELLKDDIGDCYHVFKMGHIKKGGGLNADGTKSYYEKSKAKKLAKYVLKVGDLLMCMTDMKGNVALLGHTALMNENDKYIVNQRVGLLRPNNDLGIDFPYLYILTNSNDFIEDLRSRANSGVQVNLSTSEIKVSKVLLPPKEINIEFDNCVKAFFESIFNNTKENQELTHLRDTLLPKLISGELAVAEVMAEKA
jgi:type I restriction enzyme S subunit